MKVVAADCPFLSHSNQLLFSGLCFYKLLTKHNEKEPTWQVFDCSCFPLKPDLRLSLFLQPTKLSVTFTHFLFIFFIYQIIFFSIQRNDPFYCICYSKKQQQQMIALLIWGKVISLLYFYCFSACFSSRGMKINVGIMATCELNEIIHISSPA